MARRRSSTSRKRSRSASPPRQTSPTKGVHFGRGPRLVSGRTPSYAGPQHRNQSPGRSAMHYPDDEFDDDDDDDSEEDDERDEEGAEGFAGEFEEFLNGGGLDLEETDIGVGIPRTHLHQDDLLYENDDDSDDAPRFVEVHRKRDPGEKKQGGVAQAEEALSGTVFPPRRYHSTVTETAADQASEDLGSEVPDLASLTSDEEKDVTVSQGVHVLGDHVRLFARKIARDQGQVGKQTVLRELFLPRYSLAVRYIGCLAIGGPDGEKSWAEMLSEEACREALVMGVVGRALKEHVFSALWFGGTKEQVDELSKMEQEAKNLDGFARTKERARKCQLYEQEQALSDPSGHTLSKATTKLTLQIERLIVPLHVISRPAADRIILPSGRRSELYLIIKHAAVLSRLIRQMDDVVYYWPPTFKDEEFTPAHMQCLNLDDMMANSPYTRHQVNGSTRPILNANSEDRSEAIVRIVAFPGVVAYRTGGGELAKIELAAKDDDSHLPPDVAAVRSRHRRAENITPASGHRTRLIAKAIVHLQWGRQRLLTKEAGTSRHLEAGSAAKYAADYAGYVELYEESKIPYCARCHLKGHVAIECPQGRERRERPSRFTGSLFRSGMPTPDPSMTRRSGGRVGGRDGVTG